MALDTTSQKPAWYDAALTVRDDTEESIVGSDLHQDAIFALRDLLRRYAAQRGLNWYVSSMVEVIAPLPGRKDWRPMPDIFVVPGLGPTSRTSYDTRHDGPMPPFVVEVASRSTWRNDMGRKANAYQLAGVREYIAFDPTGDFLGTAIRAWHGEPGSWVEWFPGSDYAWHSAVLGVALRPQGLLLRVFDSAGSPVETSDELDARARRLTEASGAMDARLRELSETTDRLDARVRELEAELARLRRTGAG